MKAVKKTVLQNMLDHANDAPDGFRPTLGARAGTLAIDDEARFASVIARRTACKAKIAAILATVGAELKPLESECKRLEEQLRDELSHRNGRPLAKGEPGAQIVTSAGSATIEARAIPAPPDHGAQVLKITPV